MYGTGSALTAVAPTLGCSRSDGRSSRGSAPPWCCRPWPLSSRRLRGQDRAVAYGVIGGLAGAGIAVGPLLGGWVTTYLTWRLVFAGEVVVVAAVLCCRRMVDRTRPDRTPPPAGRSGSGAVGGRARVGRTRRAAEQYLGMATAPQPSLHRPGLLPDAVRRRRRGDRPRPVRPLGAAAGGSGRRAPRTPGPAAQTGTALRAADAAEPEPHPVGAFFVIPLYLQVVQGFDAFQTGLRLLPVSVTMFAASVLASRWAGLWGRAGWSGWPC